MQNKTLIYKFKKLLIKQGKIALANKNMAKTLELLRNKGIKNPENYLVNAVKRAQPALEVRSVKKSGNSFQVPTPISHKRRQNIAIRWIVKESQKKNKTTRNTLPQEIAYQLVCCFKGEGKVINKKNSIHRLAQNNRAVMHLRWQ